MSKKKIKVAEASNTQLDWLVAKIGGDKVVWYDKQGRAYERSNWDVDPLYKPTSNWSQGGPIIEREKIATRPAVGINAPMAGWQTTTWPALDWPYQGPTPLIAAMRCYVASKLGETVEVPEELT